MSDALFKEVTNNLSSLVGSIELGQTGLSDIQNPSYCLTRGADDLEQAGALRIDVIRNAGNGAGSLCAQSAWEPVNQCGRMLLF